MLPDVSQTTVEARLHRMVRAASSRRSAATATPDTDGNTNHKVILRPIFYIVCGDGRFGKIMIDFDPGSEKRAVPPIGAFNLILIAIVIAVVGLVCLVLKVPVGAAVFGAAGLVLGGYCMGYVHKHAGGDRKLLALSGVVLFISVIAFMLGFVDLANSL